MLKHYLRFYLIKNYCIQNNFHFVKARLGQLYTKTGNSQKLEEARLALEKEYSEMEEAAYAEYFATVWSKLSLIARPDQPVQPNSKLNDKEKDIIKGKFRRFNAFFEEITTANRWVFLLWVFTILIFYTFIF